MRNSFRKTSIIINRFIVLIVIVIGNCGNLSCSTCPIRVYASICCDLEDGRNCRRGLDLWRVFILLQIWSERCSVSSRKARACSPLSKWRKCNVLALKSRRGGATNLSMFQFVAYNYAPFQRRGRRPLLLRRAGWNK